MHQLRYTIRVLKRHGGLTLLNIVCMALGLVAAGIVLGYVYQEYHYDSRYPHSNRIYRVIMQDETNPSVNTFPALAEALQSDYPEVEEAVNVSFFYGYLSCKADSNQFNERMAIFADPGFFSLFSFPMAEGDPEQCLEDPNSVVISQSAATKYFGTQNPMGKELLVGGQTAYRVTGVYRDFHTDSNFQGDIVLPISTISTLTQVWIGSGWENESDIYTFVLLSGGTDPRTFTGKTGDFISHYKADSPYTIAVQSLQDIHVDEQYLWESRPRANTQYLHILLMVAFIILLVSSANFLFLYVGTLQQRRVNTGIRKICGATKTSLFMDHFREVTTMMLLSGALAVWLYSLYNTWAVSRFSFLPKIVFVDSRLILMLLLVLFAIAILSSLYPSTIVAAQKPTEIFQNTGSMLPGKVRMISVLVTGQFIVCTILIVSALLIHQQVQYLEQKDPGYPKDELIAVPLNMHVGNGIYNDQFDVFSNELKQYPGITNVTMAIFQPTSTKYGPAEPGWEGQPADKKVSMRWGSVYYDYFQTLGINIVRGRGFQRNHPGDEVNWDTREAAFIVNEKAVQEMGLTDPIGKTFEVWGFKGPIIGVVEDYNFQPLRAGITPMFYELNPIFLNEILIRFDPGVSNVTQNIETVWSKFVPNYPLEFQYLSDQVNALYSKEQNLATLLNIFSLLGIVIACMGLLTLTVLATNQRTKEIGIRKALGASVTEITQLLVRNYLKWVVVATLIAFPIAWYAMHRWLRNFAYRADMTIWPFLLAGAAATVIALLTVSWQAVRAARANPVEALRYE